MNGTDAPPGLSKAAANHARPRTVGFNRPDNCQSPVETAERQPQRMPAPSRPTPRRRAKGRLFIACVMLSIFGSMGLMVWNEFLRFQAYGSMEGKVVHVSAPWGGMIEQVFVKDGDWVSQGQVLAQLNNAELRLKIASLDDAIRLAEASLVTRAEELRSREQEQALQVLRTETSYYEILSQLHGERARMRELQAVQQALSGITVENTISQVELAQSAAAAEGQRERVHSLEETAARLKAGLATIEAMRINPATALEAEQSKLETLRLERTRLAAFEQLGMIYSPVSGRVLQSAHWAGEYIDQAAELFEVLDHDSLHAVLYIRQSQIANFQINQKIHLVVPPESHAREFIVDRIDDETAYPPANLSRFYRQHERLVVVLAKPVEPGMSDTQRAYPTWVGAEVRLPYSLGNMLPSLPQRKALANR